MLSLSVRPWGAATLREPPGGLGVLSTRFLGCPAEWGALGVLWEAVVGCHQLVLGAVTVGRR